MSALLAWLSAAPQGAVAILCATLAALVALLVAILTQWVLGRRARTELLTKKLEDLYLVLNEISTHSVVRFEESLPLATASPFNRPKVSGGSSERRERDLHKKIGLLVRLYFPSLNDAHQEVLRCNNTVHALIYEAETGRPLSEDRLMEFSGVFRDAIEALGTMEDELIQNRLVLVRDYFFPIRYKRSTTGNTKMSGLG
jgi:hypothetical protein